MNKGKNAVPQTSDLEQPVAIHNLLTFHVDSQLYAIPIEPVAQVVSMVTITPIPQASNLTEGVINVHGEVVPVVDLHRHLGKQKIPYHFHTPIILTKIQECLLGLIVEDVSDVISLPAEQITHPGDILPKELHNETVLSGVTYLPQGAVLILDPDQLFHTDQLQVLALASEYLVKDTNTGNEKTGASKSRSRRPRSKKA